MNLDVIKQGANKLLGSRALLVKAHSPEILLTAGIIGAVASTVLACRATLKVEHVVTKHQYNIDKLELVMEKVKTGEVSLDDYSEQDRKKDLTIIYTQTGMGIAKLYAPAVVVGAASIGCILGAHNILRARNLAVMAAYKVLDEGFKSYRQRVVEEYGEEKDYMLRHNLHAEQVTELVVGEDGKTKKVKSTRLVAKDPDAPSIYARWFDDSCTQWSPTPMYNLAMVRAQQNYFNDMLKVRGHVFLNEIYEAFGMDHTQAGAIVGWVLGNGDNFIDFGVFDEDNPRTRAFCNGHEANVLLDFNVDGVVYDLI